MKKHLPTRRARIFLAASTVLALAAVVIVVFNAKLHEHAQQPSPFPPADTSTVSLSTTVAEPGPSAGLPAASQHGTQSAPYAIENVAHEYSRLSKMAAAGDLMAAKELYDALTTCRSAPRTGEDFAHAIERVNDPKQKSRIDSLPGGSRAIVDYKTKLFSYCNGVSDEQIAELPRWNYQLAESGDSEAKLHYIELNKPSDPSSPDYVEQRVEYQQKASAYLQSEIDAGNNKALLVMSQAYSQPVMRGELPAFDSDNALAYEYYYAYSLTLGDGLSDEAVGRLAQLERGLAQDEIDRARLLGQQIATGCCS